MYVHFFNPFINQFSFYNYNHSFNPVAIAIY